MPAIDDVDLRRTGSTPRPRGPQKRRVFVCSPLRPRDGFTYADHVDLAKRLCVAAVRAGVAPFAPHIFYTSIGLDDHRQTDRDAGIACGLRYLAVADEVWVYADDLHGCSEGMRKEVELAQSLILPVTVVWMPNCWVGLKPVHLEED